MLKNKQVVESKRGFILFSFAVRQPRPASKVHENRVSRTFPSVVGPVNRVLFSFYGEAARYFPGTRPSFAPRATRAAVRSPARSQRNDCPAARSQGPFP